ncbi:YezD family protein [Bacillus sp. JJ634]
MEKDKQSIDIFQRLQEMLASMRYGSITLVIQDGKVIQVERNEKVRIK